MAGRGRLLPPGLGGRVALGGPGPLRVSHGARHVVGTPIDVLPPSVSLLEQKLEAQHVEIQRLLTENQKLAMTHVALRQELAATQQEAQRVQQAFSALTALHNEKEQQVKALAEKTAKLEADLRTTEPLKAELENAKAGAHKLLALRQDLSNQITQLTQELHRSRDDVQQLPTIKAEVEALRQEISRARTAFEYEKKANTELLEHRGAMEKNLVSMAREVEKLRAELTNSEMKARVGSYGGTFGASASGYGSLASYGDAYGLSQMPVAAENAYGAYDLQRISGAHLRR